MLPQMRTKLFCNGQVDDCGSWYATSDMLESSRRQGILTRFPFGESRAANRRLTWDRQYHFLQVAPTVMISLSCNNNCTHMNKNRRPLLEQLTKMLRDADSAFATDDSRHGLRLLDAVHARQSPCNSDSPGSINQPPNRLIDGRNEHLRMLLEGMYRLLPGSLLNSLVFCVIYLDGMA